MSRELDALVIQYMGLIDHHLTATARLADRFQQGREQISQAKYIMGPRNVSADCYDLRMKALRGVTIHGPKDMTLRDLRAEQQRAAEEIANAEQDTAATTDQYGQVNETGKGSCTVEATKDQIQSDRSGLRRRGGTASVASSNDGDTLVDEDKYTKSKKTDVVLGSTTATSTTKTIEPSTTDPPSTTDAVITAAAVIAPASVLTSSLVAPLKKKKERNPDPLLWFGVFVPAPLRNAQSCFQKGLQDVIEMALIRQELLELEGAIKALRISKETLVSQSPIPALEALNVEGSSEEEGDQEGH
ncbi:hypothetical protein EDD11_006026 [Mortierella claussenii]|nr:hypothetical protein EDD11_006026 [Mortierella claussenii]